MIIAIVEPWNAMQKFSKNSDRLVFVCYYPGAGGEKLSTQISQLEVCTTLLSYYTEQSRTVITNDLFAKTFLIPVGPFEHLIDKVKALQIDWDRLTCWQVVPSHWDVECLESFFPDSKFIRIISPKNLAVMRANTNKKVMEGRCHSLLELKGYCLMYVSPSIFQDLLISGQLHLTMTIGQIHAVLEPFISSDSPEQLFCYGGTNLYKEEIIKKNVMNIPYEKVDQCMADIENFLTESGHGLLQEHA